MGCRGEPDRSGDNADVRRGDIVYQANQLTLPLALGCLGAMKPRMKIKYYKSVVCPRCIPVSAVLSEWKQRHPEVEVEVMEVLFHPAKAYEAGVRRIPSLEIDGEIKSWFLPSKEEVRSFLESKLSAGRGV